LLLCQWHSHCGSQGSKKQTVCCIRCNIKQVVENIRNRGFSLIELLIAIVVVGVLAAMALPAYTSQLRKSARAAGNDQ
jgi:prepilin-type N-terminal cleavage/methylation domain-containing protein